VLSTHNSIYLIITQSSLLVNTLTSLITTYWHANNFSRILTRVERCTSITISLEALYTISWCERLRSGNRNKYT
jgi:hypothetical protein